MVEYQQEFLEGVLSEAEPLIRKHYEEVYPYRDVFNWNMDWDTYHALEKMGMLKIFTARSKGSLIGYLWVLISPNLHSKGERLSYDDGLFIDADHRRLSTVCGLIRFTEKCLKEDGLKTFSIIGTVGKPIDALMKRMGYKAVETKFHKEL